MELALRSEITGSKNDHRLQMQKQCDEHANALQHSHTKLTDLLTDHKVGLEKHVMHHHELLRQIIEEKEAERFRHGASLQERLDILEAALVKEDEELRERQRSS